MSRHKSFDDGFTLIEIMLVVTIIMILAALVVPRITRHSLWSRISATKAQIATIETALSQFEMHASRFPTTEEGLKALVFRPAGLDESRWPTAYLKKVPRDGFGQKFTYAQPPERGMDFDLISAGPDGEIGTGDDIVNYEGEEQQET